MTPRQERIFRSVVREYIRTGEPVGSETLREHLQLPLSAATVRAELAALEGEEVLAHPHTSAGRIPTTAGYRYYVDHCVTRAPLRRVSAEFGTLGREAPVETAEALAQELAHTLARLASTLAIVALPHRSPFEAGVSHIARRREFLDPTTASDLDRLVEAIAAEPTAVSALLEDGPTVLIDGEIPFARTPRLSITLASPTLPTGEPFLAALVGPTRSPYDLHLRVLASLQEAFAERAV